MGRKASVRYWPSKEGYCCQYRGKPCVLAKGPKDDTEGPTYLAALEAFQNLMASGAVYTAGSRNILKVVLDKYLQDVKSKLAPGTFTNRVSMFRLVSKELGDKTIDQLKPMVIKDFIAKMRTTPRTVVTYRGVKRTFVWGDGRVRAFVANMQAAFAWAIKNQLIPNDPLEKIASDLMVEDKSRAQECVLSSEDHTRILSLLKRRPLRHIVICLENSGCRPSELINATGRNFDAKLGALVFLPKFQAKKGDFIHKTAHKQKERVIYFTGEALDIVKTLAEKYPLDHLFRNQQFKPYKKISFNNLKRRMGLPHLSPYSYRHTLATRWLLAGKPIETLALLLGNSPMTIRKFYSHVCDPAYRQQLRAQLEAFKSGT